MVPHRWRVRVVRDGPWRDGLLKRRVVLGEILDDLLSFYASTHTHQIPIAKAKLFTTSRGLARGDVASPNPDSSGTCARASGSIKL